MLLPRLYSLLHLAAGAGASTLILILITHLLPFVANEPTTALSVAAGGTGAVEYSYEWQKVPAGASVPPGMAKVPLEEGQLS